MRLYQGLQRIDHTLISFCSDDDNLEGIGKMTKKEDAIWPNVLYLWGIFPDCHTSKNCEWCRIENNMERRKENMRGIICNEKSSVEPPYSTITEYFIFLCKRVLYIDTMQKAINYYNKIYIKTINESYRGNWLLPIYLLIR